MNTNFYSHGKLLITGEYFVLEGSTAFAVPLKLGQSMTVSRNEDGKNELTWSTSIKNKHYFRSVFDIKTLALKFSTDLKLASHIQTLLKNIKLESDVLNESEYSIEINTNLEFPFEWGLGSSSSLISNLAYWANINPYKLLFDTSKGSGYDIACARSESPILYELLGKPVAKEVSFSPNFIDKIYFVYLGKKQNSLLSVDKHWNKIKGNLIDAQRITEISNAIIDSSSLEEFEEYVIEHESIISRALKLPTVKSQQFPDFKGTVKSLGAWGGDFVMVTHNGNSNDVVEYFNNKGLNIMFPYKDLVL